jgi:hypothetical protein
MLSIGKALDLEIRILQRRKHLGQRRRKRHLGGQRYKNEFSDLPERRIVKSSQLNNPTLKYYPLTYHALVAI